MTPTIKHSSNNISIFASEIKVMKSSTHLVIFLCVNNIALRRPSAISSANGISLSIVIISSKPCIFFTAVLECQHACNSYRSASDFSLCVLFEACILACLQLLSASPCVLSSTTVSPGEQLLKLSDYLTQDYSVLR